MVNIEFGTSVAGKWIENQFDIPYASCIKFDLAN